MKTNLKTIAESLASRIEAEHNRPDPQPLIEFEETHAGCRYRIKTLWIYAEKTAATVRKNSRRRAERAETTLHFGCKAPSHYLRQHAQALTLYGSETVAADTMERHLQIQGLDLDPAVVKRATAFVVSLRRGHTLTPYGEDTYRATGDSADILAAVLDRYSYKGYGKFSGDEVEELRDKGFILNVIE